MFSYTYLREKIDGKFTIPNETKTIIADGVEEQLYLAKYIQTEMSKNCRICCYNNTCTIYFENALTDSEKATLDNVVIAYIT